MGSGSFVSNKLKIHKRLPYYIVQQTDLRNNTNWYRLHDIYVYYCWSCTSSLKDILENAALKCIREPDILDVYFNLDKLSCAETIKYRDREGWLAHMLKDGKPVPWDYYQEYDALLEGNGEFSDKYNIYKLLPEDYIKESISDYKTKLNKANKWVHTKLKTIKLKEKKAQRIRDLILDCRYSMIKASVKSSVKASTHEKGGIKILIKNFNRG